MWRVRGRCTHCCSVLAGTVGVAVGRSSIGYMFRVGGGSSERPGVPVLRATSPSS